MIEQAGLNHAAALEALHAQSFPVPWRAEEFAALLRQPGVAGWIASGLRTTEGFILVRAAADEAEILTLAVAPECRRKGLASSLLREVFDQLRGGNALRLFLEVAADNAAALALYGRNGFEVCGRRPAYYRNDPDKTSIDAILMMRVP